MQRNKKLGEFKTQLQLKLMDYHSIVKFADVLLTKKDPYNHHGRNVSAMSMEIAERLNLSEEKKDMLYYSARLHDVGKILLTDDLLNLNRKLTTNEYERMKAHCFLGAIEILTPLNTHQEIIDAVYSHHEHWDGSGYPRALKEEQIPKHARIITICDCWDSMTSDRAYRRKMLPEKALEEMNKYAKWFDPNYYAIFLGVIKSLI